MEPNKLDTWLNDQLGDFSAELPAASWSSFQASRKKKKRRFLIWFLIAGTAASLATGFFIGRESMKEPIAQNSTPIEKDGSIENQAIIKEQVDIPVTKEILSPSTGHKNSEEKLIQYAESPIRESIAEQNFEETANLEPKIVSSELISEQAKIIAPISNLKTIRLVQEAYRFSKFGQWAIGFEIDRASIKSKGLGPNADLYNEIYANQNLNSTTWKIGVDRVKHLSKNFRASAGIYFSSSSSDGQLQIDKVDTNSPPFQNWNQGGLGNQAVEKLTASSNYQLGMTYNSFEMPLYVQYYMPVGRWGGMVVGLGLRPQYNFNEKIDWYSINPNNQNIDSEKRSLNRFTLAKELSLGWEQAFNPRTRFSLAYVLRLPQKVQYQHTDYSIGRTWEHGIKLRYIIP